ncbi:zinc-dependent metalloprotease [Austwickia chelonae]|uniref:zinc-dependent metalloprotease n=1 Tax=Austwickia chelonae TaxID=100225 RepID=UPI000E22ABE6|nr:zinc-dependent metalloprotease [Austwickia chelonae]
MGEQRAGQYGSGGPGNAQSPDDSTGHPEPAAEPLRLINWELALKGIRRITPAGPVIDRAQADEVVADLHSASQRAYDPVARTSGLHAPTGPETALVVDRPTWARINIDSFAALIDPVVDAAVRSAGRPEPGLLARHLAGATTAGELTVLMSFLATKILGQYDLAYSSTNAPRLLLVAPNIVQVERELDLDPHDFRLWVCLHEETHRVQFTAVPWLREHMIGQTRRIAADLMPRSDQVLHRLTLVAKNAGAALRPGGAGLAELFLDEGQRADIARLSAVMALLEGHADVVMDEVGPHVVPTVDLIRRRFESRRHEVTGLAALFRRALGLEAKMAQYRDGAAFVREVTAAVGLDGFNAVWDSPQTLPDAQEIQDPAAWIARVHG